MSNILIVEDNCMIADQVEDNLLANGYQVCGIASTVASALDLYHAHKPDLIIIDIRLEHGELGTALATHLAPFDGLGILYVTGSSNDVDLTEADGHACLSKPYVAADLLRSVQSMFELLEAGEATPPFPSGFRFLPPAAPAEFKEAS